MRPRLLDLCAGGGGAAYGYVRAGFDVMAVDNHIRRDLPPTPHIKWIKADMRKVLLDTAYLRTFDAWHASPPCQLDTRAKHLRDAQGGSSKVLVNLIPHTQRAFHAEERIPWVIENVEGAPLRRDLLLCGSMYPELSVDDETGHRWLKRHRIFEANLPLSPPRLCDHKAAGVRPLGVYASKSDNIPSGGQTARTLEEGRTLMGIPWMSWSALVEAIPPVYTETIGRQMLAKIGLEDDLAFLRKHEG